MNTPIQFQLQFATLLRVRLCHEYYREGYVPGLRIVPDAATQIWLRNHQMIFKPQGDAFTIGVKAGAVEALRPDPRVVLRFEAYTSDPHLDSVTAGPFRKAHEIFYHAALSPQNQDWERIAVQGSQFILKISAADSNKPLTIKDKANNTVWEDSPQGDTLAVQLPHDTTGYHAVHDAEGATLLTQYHLPKRKPGLFAAIEVPVQTLLQPDWEVHELTMDSRAVTWRYLLVPYHPTADLDRITLTTSHRETPYRWLAPERITLHTGQAAIVLTSEQPIPLQAVPQWRFVLKALKTDTQEHIQIQLPTPQRKQLTAVPEVTDHLRADMYVRY